MKFKEIKEKIIEKAKKNNACSDEFKRAISARTKKQLLQVVFDNAHWCIRETDTITIEDLENFGRELCNEIGFYWDGEFTVENKVVFAWDNSTVEAWGNSTVKAWGNSTVEAWGNSTVKAFDNSTVKAFGNSTVKAFDNSTVKAFDNSTVEALGNSTVKALDNSTVKAFGNSTVKAFGNSTVKAFGNSTVEALGNSTVKITNSCFAGKTENVKIESNLAQLINIKERKIYVKKDQFEIVEL